jgi:phospholipase D1/2
VLFTGPAWFDVTDSKGKKTGASLHLALQYVSMEQLSKSPELPDTYFDISSDNRVTLYQDAHTPATPLLTSITLSDGRKYKPTNAWIDIYEALNGARHLIYITGWSVYTRITLVRGAEGGDKGETLGELLKAKAKDGVRVLILVWDERMSTDVTAGLLGTHDNETAIYFQGSGVEVVLVPRQKRGAAGVLDSNWTSTCFSHHQKSVIVDADVPAGQGFGAGDKRRRFITFIGGLDLTDGRYDTQQHALFSTLATDHKDDFYQKCFTVDKTVGPREPWHDVHAKLEGPAAYDVLKNFEERWRMQAKHKGNLLVSYFSVCNVIMG